MRDLAQPEQAPDTDEHIAAQLAESAHPIRAQTRPIRAVRPLQHGHYDPDSPVDITLNESLATAMNWSIYFTLPKVDQALMLDRVFHDDIKAKNARKIVSRLTNFDALLDLVNGPRGIRRSTQIQQTNQAIDTLHILIRTVDNGSTQQDRALAIIADMVEAVTVLHDNRATLINRSTL